MEKKKKKNAFGWFQVFNGDPKKNEEVFNHMMNDHPNTESSSETTSSESAMAEAFNDMMKNPENNLEAMRALSELDEEWLSPELLDQKYDKHVLGKEGDRWAYFKNKKWTKEDYVKKAEELQETPVDGKKVIGWENEDGSIQKFFPNTPEKYFVIYRIKNGVKKTINLYSLPKGNLEYIFRKNKNAEEYGPNQRDLELGEAIKLL